jgi:plastin-1
LSLTREDCFAEDEASVYARMINERLNGDEDCKNLLPMNASNLFNNLLNGVVLCKLVNCAQPSTIDERVVVMKDDMNDLDKVDNLSLAISSSKAIGCQLNDVTAATVTTQQKPAVLGYLWQVLKVVFELIFLVCCFE